MLPANEVAPQPETEGDRVNGDVAKNGKPNGSNETASQSPSEQQPQGICCTFGPIFPSALLLSAGVSIIICDAFDVVHKNTVEGLFFVLYLIALLGMLALFISHGLNRLTVDILEAGDKKQGFSRGGIYVLGSGGMIYQALNLYAFGLVVGSCHLDMITAKTAISLIVSGMQVLFLVKFRLVKINRSTVAAFMSRLVLAHMVTLNLCVWIRTIVTESLHEIEHSDHEDTHGDDEHHDDEHVTHDPHMTQPTTAALHHDATTYGHANTGNLSVDCSTNDLVNLVSPYAYPLLIEFSVLAVGLYITIYERCGIKDDAKNSQEAAEESGFVFKSHGDSVIIKHDINNSIIYNNTSEGLFLGWLFILLTIIFVIACLYDSYTELGYRRNYGLAVYGFNLMLVAACLMGACHAIWRIRIMETFKNVKDSQERREHMLLDLTLFCMVIYKILAIAAGAHEGEAVLIVDGLVSIASGVTTTVFINKCAFNKRLTHPLQRASKPGRQDIEVIRSLNFALWLVNTFLLKATYAKEPMVATFGDTAWPIISNIVQPMTILFYFHTMMCASDVIAHLHTWHMHEGEVRTFSQLPHHDKYPHKPNYPRNESKDTHQNGPVPSDDTIDIPL